MCGWRSQAPPSAARRIGSRSFHGDDLFDFFGSDLGRCRLSVCCRTQANHARRPTYVENTQGGSRGLSGPCGAFAGRVVSHREVKIALCRRCRIAPAHGRLDFTGLITRRARSRRGRGSTANCCVGVARRFRPDSVSRRVRAEPARSASSASRGSVWCASRRDRIDPLVVGAAGDAGKMGAQRRRDVFSNAVFVVAPCAGWRGRALM